MKMRVTFEITLSEETLAKTYGPEFIEERKHLLSQNQVVVFGPGEKGANIKDETLRLMAWDFVLGRANH